MGVGVALGVSRGSLAVPVALALEVVEAEMVEVEECVALTLEE